MSEDLALVIAKRFIQRRDVKAQQFSSGGYTPVTDNGQTDGVRLPFMMEDITAHLAGTKTYGHYLLDTDNKCKLFAFDIDLRKNDKNFTGHWPELPDLTGVDPVLDNDEWKKLVKLHEFDPREAWRDRSHPARNWTKFQMRMLTTTLARTIKDLLDIPVATAYTGNKGVHVYGFTGSVSASDAREAADIVLAQLGCFESSKGAHFFQYTDQDPLDGYPNFEIEVFPKQTNLAGKDLGNLMRLPLGVNRKSPQDPTFFIDERLAMGELRPHTDPVKLLQSGNPWA